MFRKINFFLWLTFAMVSHAEDKISNESGNEVKIFIKNGNDAGIYSPELHNIDSGKQILFEKIKQDDLGTEWRSTVKTDGDCDLMIIDHHPSISSSCIYTKRVSVDLESSTFEVEIPNTSLGIVIPASNISNIPIYFSNNQSVIVGRLRRVDNMGKVNRWFFLLLDEDGSYKGKVNNIQSGDYLIDLMEKELQVSGGDKDIGYAVWTQKLKVGDHGGEIILHVTEAGQESSDIKSIEIEPTTPDR